MFVGIVKENWAGTDVAMFARSRGSSAATATEVKTMLAGDVTVTNIV